MLLKRISIIVICLFGFLCLTLNLVSAEESSSENGKIRLKTERIGEEETSGEQGNVETELDKIFPNLFREETTAIIRVKQIEMNQTMGTLEKSIFTMIGEKDTALNDVKETLFTEDYLAPEIARQTEQMDEKDKNPMSKGIFGGLIGFVFLLCGGIYTMFWKFS